MTVTVRLRDQWILGLTPAVLRLKINAARRWLETGEEPWPRAWEGTRRQLTVMEQRLAELEPQGQQP